MKGPVFNEKNCACLEDASPCVQQWLSSGHPSTRKPTESLGNFSSGLCVGLSLTNAYTVIN